MLPSCFSRKHEADRLRASHMQAPARKPQPRPGVHQPRKTLPAAASSNPAPVSDGDDADEEESESDGSQASAAIRRPRALDNAVFPSRVHPVRTACKGCGLYDCPSCACMCEGSSLWIDHPGGHFFRDCMKCGGTECPGCACVCRYSTVWTEHGGHVVTAPKKKTMSS
jgi:hypothetical protein